MRAAEPPSRALLLPWAARRWQRGHEDQPEHRAAGREGDAGAVRPGTRGPVRGSRPAALRCPASLLRCGKMAALKRASLAAPCPDVRSLMPFPAGDGRARRGAVRAGCVQLLRCQQSGDAV